MLTVCTVARRREIAVFDMLRLDLDNDPLGKRRMTGDVGKKNPDRPGRFRRCCGSSPAASGAPERELQNQLHANPIPGGLELLRQLQNRPLNLALIHSRPSVSGHGEGLMEKTDEA